eukprot:GHVU01168452.1.p3 GENE.GHVU01168452.1~~GHVU01168452.1.p3  ORF type:complete len:101 (+),score=15.39 GHVU01168452.1:215-517(+)
MRRRRRRCGCRGPLMISFAVVFGFFFFALPPSSSNALRHAAIGGRRHPSVRAAAAAARFHGGLVAVLSLSCHPPTDRPTGNVRETSRYGGSASTSLMGEH